jgi:hypothetical protein
MTAGGCRDCDVPAEECGIEEVAALALGDGEVAPQVTSQAFAQLARRVYDRNYVASHGIMANECFDEFLNALVRQHIPHPSPNVLDRDFAGGIFDSRLADKRSEVVAAAAIVDASLRAKSVVASPALYS